MRVSVEFCSFSPAFITFSMCIVAPRKAIGDKRVGGSPACGPEAAIKLLQLIKKFSNMKVFAPFTNTTDSGLWSICTSCFSLRLKTTIKETANANPVPMWKAVILILNQLGPLSAFQTGNTLVTQSSLWFQGICLKWLFKMIFKKSKWLFYNLVIC